MAATKEQRYHRGVLHLGLVLLAATPEVHLDEPLPLSLLLSTPTGEVAAINTSEILRILDELFTEHTDLRPAMLDAALMGECRGRLVCLSIKSRAREDAPNTRYLLVVSNVTAPDQPDRMSALLVDTDEAIRLYDDADRTSDHWEDELEARVATAAVLGEVRRKELRSPEEARAFMRELVTEILRGPLEATGHYEPYGSIRISSNVEGAAVAIDGNTVGVTGEQPILVARVRPGAHMIELQHREHRAFSESVDVVRGERTEVAADLLLLDAGVSGLPGKIVFWSGIALSVAGAALIAVAIATQDRDLTTGCWEPGCGGSSFTALGRSTAGDAEPEEVNPSGVLTAPLGYSLLGTGATFSIGSLFERSSVPWISLIAGVVIGGTAYGLSAALDGPHL
jgi:hypothetical protein